jgi:hypothetical protein
MILGGEDRQTDCEWPGILAVPNWVAGPLREVRAAQTRNSKRINLNFRGPRILTRLNSFGQELRNQVERLLFCA